MFGKYLFNGFNKIIEKIKLAFFKKGIVNGNS
jgi:hypothetical protein